MSCALFTLFINSAIITKIHFASIGFIFPSDNSIEIVGIWFVFINKRHILI